MKKLVPFAVGALLAATVLSAHAGATTTTPPAIQVVGHTSILAGHQCHKLTGITVGLSSPAVFASEQFKGDNVVSSADPITTIGWVSIGVGDYETLQICLASPAPSAVPIEYMILNVNTPVCHGCALPSADTMK